MIDRYLFDKMLPLHAIPREDRPTYMQKVRAHFGEKPKGSPPPAFDRNPELLDALWGIYFATGAAEPVLQIVAMLPWSKDNDSVERLTVGNMAKFTLATNAARDADLLVLLKWAAPHQKKKDVRALLDEAIEAAETADTARIRKDALGALDELRRKGPGFRRNVSFWGQVGQGAIALGCIAAATTGHVEFGIPCVLGGAASGAALHFWNSQP